MPKLAFAVFAVVLACLSGHAQVTSITNETATPVEGAGHDYIHLLSETVNPASGSVSLRIELPMPKSRGITIPFSFAYDSGSARPLTGVDPNYPMAGYLSQSGWNYSVPMLSASGEMRQYDTDEGTGWPPQHVTYTCPTWSNYVFSDTTGGRHLLGIATQKGTDQYVCPYSSSSTRTGGDSQIRATLPGPYAPSDPWNPGSLHELPVKAFTADGTVYNFSSLPRAFVDNMYYGLADTIEDRNGNVFHVTDSGNGAFTYTDTSGRSVLTSSGFGSNGGQGTTVTVAGETYQIYWTMVTANFTRSQSTADTGIPIVGYTCGFNPSVHDTMTVISRIVLPNGQSYYFHYGTDNSDPAFQNNFGLLNEIVYPSGAWVKYSWRLSPPKHDVYTHAGILLPGSNINNPVCFDYYSIPVVTSRQVGTTASAQPTMTQAFDSYSTSWGTSGTPAATQWTNKVTHITTTDNIRNQSAVTVYTYLPVLGPRDPFDPFGVAPQLPVEQQIQSFDFDSSFLQRVDKTWYSTFDVASEQTTLENGLTSKTVYCYEGTNCAPLSSTFSRLVRKDEYEFGQGSPGSLVRRTLTNYANLGTMPTGGIIATLPSSVVIQDGNGNRVAQTDYSYDQTATVNIAAINHDDSGYPSGTGTVRGNLTTKTEYCFAGSTNCTNSTTTYTYDSSGQVRSITDPCGNSGCPNISDTRHTTTYSYDDSYTGGSPPGQTNALVTAITNPLGHTSTFSYAYSNSQGTVSKDANDQSTHYEYNDPFFRPTRVSYPDDGWSEITYNDSAPFPSATQTRLINSSPAQNLVTKTVSDAFGRTIRTEVSPDTPSAVITETTYDGMGRVRCRSNAHGSSSAPTDGNTCYEYDALGRLKLTTQPDGSTVQTAYSGNVTTVTDEASNQRRSVVDALGRLIEVDEPGQTGGSAATHASGSFTVNGSAQSIVQGSNAPGSGSVTVGGTLQSWQTQTADGTQSTGWVTINGSLQSKQTQTAAATNSTGSVNITGSLQSKQTQIAAATQSTGSVTINGLLQSKQVQTQPGTGGRATLTISGGEQSYDPCSLEGYGNCPVYDSGFVYVTVNGYQASGWWGEGDWAGDVAARLAASLNASASPVTASASGDTVTLVAKATGTLSNYPLSMSSQTNMGGYFSYPSFTISGPGALSGGTNATYTTLYDSGTTTITINGQPVSYSWSGSGTSASNIASNLGSRVNSNSSYATASVSGTTVYLTSRTTGGGVNYSLSSSSSYNSGEFGGPSFTTANSGGSLTGGHDTQYRTDYDSGTTTITINGQPVSYNWSGSGTSASSIASTLGSLVNSSSSYATASVSGGAIYLTSRTTGSGVNYSLSSSSSYNSGLFTGPSFSTSNSGGSLTGGQNAQYRTDYDSGTTTITINGQPISYSWSGSGTTSSTIAWNLGSRINSSSSYATASITGTTVQLTSRTGGASVNYSLSSTSSYDSANFAGPSFTTSKSGATLTGGTDAQYTTNYDSGTSRITINGQAVSYNWSGSTTTKESIAAGLAFAVNNSSSYAMATSSGAVVSLTARTSGSSTNYSLSASTSSSRSSFTTTASGAAFTGGTSASTIYDSGTVQVTVGSTTATVNYNSSTTAASIASSFASQLSSSSVSATASGTTVNLTSVATGAAMNFALSTTSTTNQPGTFSQPSFAVSLSGANLTGGANANPGTFSLSTPWVTLYKYDTLGNLLCVWQKGLDTNSLNFTYDPTTNLSNCMSAPAAWRPRMFVYNSMSRLLNARNPESGEIAYGYDVNGNVTTKRDVRNQYISYCHDPLSRVTKKQYGNSISCASPNVSYTYDVSAGGFSDPYPIGRRTGMSYGSTSAYFSHDRMGRLVGERATINGITKDTGVTYNPDSSIRTITYPHTVGQQGRVVSYTYDNNARPLSVSDGSTTYATVSQYAPFGAVWTGSLGSNITLSNSYNNRLQPITLSAVGPSGTLMSKTYDFHHGSSDNGNLWSITDGLDPLNIPNRQIGSAVFTYDGVNRIVSAESSGSDCTVIDPSRNISKNWGNTYSIDAWGNLYNKSVTKCTSEYLDETIDPATNRFAGRGYDAAGNMTENGLHGFDAESRLVSLSGNLMYTYDADGDRVAKPDRLYWAGSSAAALMESNASGTPVSEYIFFGGQRVARIDGSAPDSPHYYISDNLGSATVIASKQGAPESEAMYFPYGGERWSSGTDSNHYKFTGKERDSETGFDYFGARYYSSSMSRFLSPDWAARAIAVPYAVFGDPQTLNLYTYVENQPLNRIDADGHVSEEAICPSGDATCQPLLQKQEKQNKLEQRQKARDKAQNQQTRENIGKTAEKYNGSTDWGFSKQKGAFACNTNKCNAFVGDVTKEAGAPASVKGSDGKSRYPLAAEWADKNTKIDNWRVLGKGETPQAGDVAAYKLSGGGTSYSGHSGIVTSVDANGVVHGMAAHENVVGPDNKFDRSVTPTVMYRRYTGDE